MSKKKSERLSMSISTATARLKKSIMFALVKQCNMDICYRCKEFIKEEKDLSVEHIEPWLNSENPKELFFDLNNIAFSHLKCNSNEPNLRKQKYFNLKDKQKAKAERSSVYRKKKKEEDPEKVKSKRKERYQRTGN